MAYKKPQLVAKSATKKMFVAGCPTNKPKSICTNFNQDCMCGPLK